MQPSILQVRRRPLLLEQGHLPACVSQNSHFYILCTRAWEIYNSTNSLLKHALQWAGPLHNRKLML